MLDKNNNSLFYKSGFTGIEILIALGIIASISGGLLYVFKKEVKEIPRSETESVSEPVPAPVVKNPFPAEPVTPAPVVTPVEPVRTPYDQGKPLPKPMVTAAGEWHGRFNVTAPDKCNGESGGWEATLYEKNGVISGNFTTDVGLSGKVGGSRSGDKAEWGIGGGESGVSFSGSISGNTMEGKFTGAKCSDDNPDRSTGSFFGGRIVK